MKSYSDLLFFCFFNPFSRKIFASKNIDSTIWNLAGMDGEG